MAKISRPELIRRQCKAAKQQEGLVLKYNATGQIEIVDELRNRLDLFMRNEEKLLEGCLRLLDEIR